MSLPAAEAVVKLRVIGTVRRPDRVYDTLGFGIPQSVRKVLGWEPGAVLLLQVMRLAGGRFSVVLSEDDD